MQHPLHSVISNCLLNNGILQLLTKGKSALTVGYNYNSEFESPRQRSGQNFSDFSQFQNFIPSTLFLSQPRLMLNELYECMKRTPIGKLTEYLPQEKLPVQENKIGRNF